MAHHSAKHCMRMILWALPFFACKNATVVPESTSFVSPARNIITPTAVTDTTSWAYFLQHLPQEQSPVKDFRGNAVPNGEKAFAVVPYDVGTRDLQQCADALMRLRAEYLFSRRRYNDISFHFTSGHLYSFRDYCNGKRPVVAGASVQFVQGAPVAVTHQSLRRYLDVVYAYAGTISLAKELKPADAFEIGTVVIIPGSPGHCFMLTDEAVDADGERLYKLVEGYTPAQSIYVLRNTTEPALGPWHRLGNGEIVTASYRFTSYSLKKFE